MNEQNKKTINDKEQETLTFWQENKIFEKTLETPAGEKPRDNFTFFDGPPFATGVPHHGHLLAGTIKDIIPRYQTMKGNHVRRVWGWDCHGLPLENIVEEKLNLKTKQDIEKLGIGVFNETARSMVFEYESEWKKVVPRMGRFIDMEHPYKTMDATYTESIWWSFKTLFEKGLIYEGHKIMHVCPRCVTTLAQSEVSLGYKDVTDISVTAKFELEGEPGTYVLAWTTTPWTLPGNVALAVNPHENYVILNKKGGVSEEDILYTEKFIVTESALDKKPFIKTDKFLEKKVLYKVDGQGYYVVENKISGQSLVDKRYKPVFDYFVNVELPNKDNLHKIVPGEFVTTDSGTGIVHIAPAFGQDDYELGRTENLPIIRHVSMDGTFIPEVTDFAGMVVKKKDDTQSTDIEIIKKLAHTGKLFSKEKLIHSYPHCWRCDTPLLNYATSSWFMDVTQIKPRLIEENQGIGWVPGHTREGRFGKWLEGARDWALSRSRYWGAPIPVWKCNECNRIEVMGSIDDLQRKLHANNEYYTMRHGECLGNTEDRSDSHGRLDNHLTEKGRREVQESAYNIKDAGFDIIITSPLLRAHETAQIVAETLGITDVTVDERLREYDFGIYDGHKFPDFWHCVRDCHYDFDKHIEGGESYRDVQKRVSSLLFDVEQKHKGKKILFVTHGGVMWMMLGMSKHFSDSQIRDYRELMKNESGSRYFIPNASVEPLHFKPYPNKDGMLDFHRPYIDEVVFSCSSECSGQMKRIPDVFDCWYESGSMPFASLHYPFENKDIFDANYPANFIAEGLDQTRGWFYSLINLGVGLFDKAPYRQVIVNGLTLAADGQKMSKSKKNYTDPMALAEKYGADSFRFALVSGPLVRGENVPFPDSLVDEVYKKVVQRFENVVTFYEMYNKEGVLPDNSSQHVLDHWIRARLASTVQDVRTSLDNYELDSATRPIDSFIDDLSTWYLRRSRERLKSDDEHTRHAALATLGFVLDETSKLIAPFMPFLAERVYQALPGEKKESVHLERFPEESHIDENAIILMEAARKIVTQGLDLRNQTGIKVRQPLASLTVNSLAGLSETHITEIVEELNIKALYENSSLAEAVLDTEITDELRAEGDVRELIRAIKDLRKEAGLQAGVNAKLLVSHATDIVVRNEEMLSRECSLGAIEIDIEAADKAVQLSNELVSIGIK